jgi:hypothetical protein
LTVAEDFGTDEAASRWLYLKRDARRKRLILAID